MISNLCVETIQMLESIYVVRGLTIAYWAGILGMDGVLPAPCRSMVRPHMGPSLLFIRRVPRIFLACHYSYRQLDRTRAYSYSAQLYQRLLEDGEDQVRRTPSFKLSSHVQSWRVLTSTWATQIRRNAVHTPEYHSHCTV